MMMHCLRIQPELRKKSWTLTAMLSGYETTGNFFTHYLIKYNLFIREKSTDFAMIMIAINS